MPKILIHTLCLSVLLVSTACGNAKFSGKGSKKKKDTAAEITPENPPTTCKPGESCVVIDPKDCKPDNKDCPVTPPGGCKPDDKACTPGTAPVDGCSKDEPDCDPSQHDPGQNPGQSEIKDPGQSGIKSANQDCQFFGHCSAPGQN